MDDVRAEVASRGGALDLTGPACGSKATRCCCVRRSAICAATPSRRAPRARSCRHPCRGPGESQPSTGAHHRHRQRPGVAERRATHVPAVFHDKAKGTGLGLALVQKSSSFTTAASHRPSRARRPPHGSRPPPRLGPSRDCTQRRCGQSQSCERRLSLRHSRMRAPMRAPRNPAESSKTFEKSALASILP